MLSVIVPVYNVQNYLRKCVDSLINQTYENLEIILVDDGSADESGKICDSYEELDRRVHVVHKENGGLADARNVGLDYAHGEWISFVDADDYIDELTYQDCIAILNKSGADACYFGYVRVNVNGAIREGACEYPEGVLYRKDMEKEILPKTFGKLHTDKYEIGSACRGVYRRSIIEENNIRFISERELLSEDYLFTTDFCMHVDALVFIRHCYYFYRYNAASLTHTFRRDRIEKTEKFFLNRLAYIEAHGLSSECRIRAEVRFWDMNCVAIYNDFDNKLVAPQIKLQEIREICESNISKKILKNVDYRYYSPYKRLVIFLVKRKWVHMILIAIWSRKIMKTVFQIASW